MDPKLPEKEADMYPRIKEYLLRSEDCECAFAVGDEEVVRVVRNSHSREVDVAALREPNGKAPEVHLVEAKCLNRGHSFDECFSQILSVRDSGDRLWVAVPKEDWRSLTEADRERNRRRLNDFHLGLLLVTPEDCHPEITAPRNPEVTESGRIEVLQQLGFAIDLFLPHVSSLGQLEAKIAASTMALICMVVDILEIEPKRVNFLEYSEYPYDEDSVHNGWFVPSVKLSESVYCELDPFGCFMQDGVPAAWVSVIVPPELICARLDQSGGFGTHIYLDDGASQWKTIPVADGREAIKYWLDRGLNVTANVCVRVEIAVRMKSSLKSDLARIIERAREFATGDADEASENFVGLTSDPP